MNEIRAADKDRVKTIIKFDIPFSLIRLPDGAYEMDFEGYMYQIKIRRVRRDKRIVKILTGWEPHGDVDIVGDRFGRISYSQIEIHIPFRIDEKMWDYFCPNCGLEIDETITECPICTATCDPPKSRVPPKMVVKRKAIDLTNRFIDAYRYHFNDYFIEHIRYDDIYSYNIEYILDDGTKASWIESFSLSPGKHLVTGSASLEETDIEEFVDILSNIENRMYLRDYLLASAENRIHTEEYHLAILEAIITLELTISNYIYSKKRSEGMSDRNTKNYIRRKGLSNNLRETLSDLESSKGKIPEKIYSLCQQTIKLRNNIAHRATIDISYNNAKEGIWSVKNIINYIIT